MSETTYQNGTISVDRNFARFGDKSYAIDKINSVEVRREPAKNSAIWILALIAVVCLIIAVSDPAPGPGILAVLFGVAAFYRYRNPDKDNYKLFLMTSSSEAQAFETKDPLEVTRLREAIEQAMTFKSA